MIRNRIREYRAKYAMKQEELAKLVGVRRETIGNLEKGRYNPSLVLAWNIAKVFHANSLIFSQKRYSHATKRDIFCLPQLVDSSKSGRYNRTGGCEKYENAEE